MKRVEDFREPCLKRMFSNNYWQNWDAGRCAPFHCRSILPALPLFPTGTLTTSPTKQKSSRNVIFAVARSVTGMKIFLGSRMRAGATAIALLLLATMSMTIPAVSGDGGTLLAQTSDALDRFVGRSPGERDETDLLKGKVRKGPSVADRLFGRRMNAGGPDQRVLGKIFDTPPEDSVKELTAGPPAPTDVTSPPGSGLLPLGEIGSPTATSDPVSGFPGGIGTVVPPGTTAVTPGDPTTPGEETPVPAVPEPQTWALMLLGFGLCGALLRRRREVSPAGVSGAARCDAA